MNGINTYHPIRVLTQRGMIELKELVPGDKVIEYGSGQPLSIKRKTVPTQDLVYKVIYNDKRYQFVGSNDYIYTGINIIPVDEINENTQFKKINQYPITHINKSYEYPVYPDHYIAGAFLIYGDYSDKYLNIPLKMSGINDVFANKYCVEYCMDHLNTEGKAYFKYQGKYGDKITWNEFFNGEDTYEKITSLSYPVIPDMYRYAALKDRIQFIRGVFDAGYFPKLFGDDIVGIIHYDISKLKVFQEMLWSVGILSKIEYNPFVYPKSDFKYNLQVIGDYHGYPGFTYMVDNIEHLLIKDNQIINYDTPFSLSIDKIIDEDMSGHNHATGYLSNLVLEKRKALYITDNYLPRVSI